MNEHASPTTCVRDAATAFGSNMALAGFSLDTSIPHLTVGQNDRYGLSKRPDRSTGGNETPELVGLGGVGDPIPHGLANGHNHLAPAAAEAR